MYKKTRLLIGAFALLILGLTACSVPSDSSSTTQNQIQISAVDETGSAATANNAASTSDDSAANTTSGPASAAEAAAENSDTHDNAEDYLWDADAATTIALAGDTITAEGAGVTIDGRTATITASGAYTFSGSLVEGQIVVDTQDEGTVQLILNGVDITNTSTAPIYVANAAETIIILTAGSDNRVADGATYAFENPEEDEPNAAIFSHDDLTISGEGSLTVEANYNDGIASKDGLIISGGTITVNAADDGIRGKDYLAIQTSDITITAGGDGLKSDEDEDATKGYIAIESGAFNIVSGGDAIQAETDVLISGGTFNIIAGGGSSAVLNADSSAKGIKGTVNVDIDGGTFTINSADDAVHSNDSLVVNDGTFIIATGDDGFHADAALTINSGVVQITESYEGIESAVITINGGEIDIVSSDDGINVAGGNDGSGGRGFGGPGQDAFATYTGSYYLYINGGYIVVNANGDGLDANGAIEMTGGTVIVNGPTMQMNGAVDHDGPFTMTGGFLAAAGSVGMAQTADAASSQYALLMNFNEMLQAGSLIHIEDENGNDILTFAPTKAYQSIAFSSPELVNGESYIVYYGGSSSGTADDGLYEGGSYSPGTEVTTFTISNIVTMIGNTGRR